MKLDPSLAYFAHIWRSPSPYAHRDFGRLPRKTILQDYHFTNSKGLPRPWQPSDETTEIILHRLMTAPRVASDRLPEGYFYSKTPIPTLLQTCIESRETLRTMAMS